MGFYEHGDWTSLLKNANQDFINELIKDNDGPIQVIKKVLDKYTKDQS
jgi:hypothetical protein